MNIKIAPEVSHTLSEFHSTAVNEGLVEQWKLAEEHAAQQEAERQAALRRTAQAETALQTVPRVRFNLD